MKDLLPRRLAQRIYRAFLDARKYSKAIGIEFQFSLDTLRSLELYFADRREFIRLATQSDLNEFPMGVAYPCLTDRYAQSGEASGHYFHQDLLVARRIFGANPRRHVDVGSRLDGFVAHVAAYRNIHVVDIRAQESRIPNISFQRADITKEIPDTLIGAFDSASCLHALEHLGLGRYGDPVAPNAYRLGLRNLASLLEANGILYLSVPIGPQRVEFNAHRVFSVEFLLRLVEADFDLRRLSFVDDKGDLHEDVPLSEKLMSENFGCAYGCGIFELQKRARTPLQVMRESPPT